MATPAQIRAHNKYNSKAYDRVNLTVPKGDKATIQAAADKAGQSLNGYIVEAVQRRMEGET